MYSHKGEILDSALSLEELISDAKEFPSFYSPVLIGPNFIQLEREQSWTKLLVLGRIDKKLGRAYQEDFFAEQNFFSLPRCRQVKSKVHVHKGEEREGKAASDPGGKKDLWGISSGDFLGSVLLREGEGIPGNLGGSHSPLPEFLHSSTDLPTASDLTPLSQPLISLELASIAFSPSNNNNNHLYDDNDDEDNADRDGSGLDSREQWKIDSTEEEDLAVRMENSENRTTLKRPQLVWTLQLHKHFVDVVAHLGIKNAVPKMIIQLMNVEWLTRENVANHFQKYRLYLKRMQGLSIEGPSSSDRLFDSTHVPQSLH
ncbi:hypothetical protein VNO77_37652 [Canavalia gladiata]|uniref:Myb-like domain-containing protein n=1 Tax=Canavalia gladiata TaxID=3824 RepID=A0AAN9KAR0_CANGL